MISVLVADDQPLMRSALKMCLSAEPDIEVVGEASDGLEAVALAERFQPDVVILDVRMPRLDGVAATARLAAAVPQTKVLIVTTFHLDEYVVSALRAGATGFLLKDARPEEIADAVRIVAAGDAILAPTVTRRLLELYAYRLPYEPTPHPEPISGLTSRELQVLKLVARGMSNSEIGHELHLAESSVKTHVGHLMTKLNLATRVHLVIFAYEMGLVPLGTKRSGSASV